MAQNVVTSNGWDLIFAASQDALNQQLAKLSSVHVKRVIKSASPIPGLSLTADVDVNLGPPQLRVKDGSGRQVDVLLPITGTLSVNNVGIPLDQIHTVVVTTQLMQIEAELTPEPGAEPTPEPSQTTYHLVIDFASPDAIVNITAPMAPVLIAYLVGVFEQIIRQDIGKDKSYLVATFTLTGNDVPAALIPYIADFSFVQDAETPGRSNLLVLMQTVTPNKGSILFAAPLLAPGQDFAVLVSNQILIQYMALPQVKKGIAAMAQNSSAVDNQIAAHQIAGQQFLYSLSNNSTIALNKDHDPWISSVTADVDPDRQALELYVDAQDDVTVFNFHVDAWHRSWWQLQVDPETEEITWEKVHVEQGGSTTLSWWEWLLAIVTGPVSVITAGILEAVVSGNAPDLGGPIDKVFKNVMQWPNQKEVKLKNIALPSHLVATVELSFSS
ncbi:hypothetical protein B0J18DRAFT_485016 [Chaetomium sp. MPI-SDFR-AT-0129]|nr:hypothetical protein B0J18DRAFT_485016 [Chaetomium sp. MPI-SDFR-AT-0129]